MNRFFYSVILLLSCLSAIAQKEYFIYLQSEAEQPFFVRLNEHTFNSSPAGYLILSKLKDSTYSFKVGFPQNKWPDQQFSVILRSRDHGFLLKNFGEKGWGLFNLQTLEVQMAAEGSSKAQKTELKEVSAFTDILSKAANDPSLREKPVFAVVRKEEKAPVTQPVAVIETALPKKEVPKVNSDSLSAALTKNEDSVGLSKSVVKNELTPVSTAKETIAVKVDSHVVKTETQKPSTSISDKLEPDSTKNDQAVVQTESAKKITASIENNAVIEKKEQVLPAESSYKKSVVIKKAESSTTEGFGLTFIDEYDNGQKDTIQIIIPNSQTILEIAKENQADQKKFLDLPAEGKETKPAVPKDISMVNCTNVASESDFFRLRKKMAGEKEDDLMISDAKKEFKAKCFSVEQIRNLGNLMLSEAGKFQFYEAAYPVCSDKSGFAVLQAEFKDPYFVHRFKNLVN